MKNRYFNVTTDERGIATLTFDTPQSSVNVLCFDALYELREHISNLEGDSTVKALFIESAKEGIFVAGADIKEIEAFRDEAEIVSKLREGQEIFNRLEQLPFPTVAVIDGACLGGGLELAMACDYRIATNAPHTRLGLVEVSLGIIPGLGGTQRLPQLVGYTKAMELITASKRLKGDKALKLGLVDASIPAGYLAFKKEEYIKEIATGTLKEKTDKRRKGIRWYERLSPVTMLIAKISRNKIVKQTSGHYPAPLKAVDVLEETLNIPLEAGLKIEREAFAPLAVSETSKNLITLFFTAEALKKETFSSAAPKPVRSAAVVGVGTMGAGIAWALAYQDIPVRLAARKMSSIAKAKAHILQSFMRIQRRGRLSVRETGLKMDRVTHTTALNGLGNADMVIEAVSEDVRIKQKVFEDLESVVREDTIIATNTSSLAISHLAENVRHPERFVGMHFFNPVERMPLVEVIAGEQTSDETVATVVALAKKLGKTPIKVAECAGFLVNRILLPYLNEAARMFEEGEDPAHIDEVLERFGMPMGPFTLADEVGIDIGADVSSILYAAYGARMQPASVLERMIEKGWLGKKSGTGFYLHQGNKRSANSEISQLQYGGKALEEREIIERAVLTMVNEAVRCLEEGVVDNAHYLDMAMVMGTGFPAFRGGLLRYAEYEGWDNILQRLNILSAQYGERFEPSGALVEMVQKGRQFYGKGDR